MPCGVCCCWRGAPVKRSSTSGTPVFPSAPTNIRVESPYDSPKPVPDARSTTAATRVVAEPVSALYEDGKVRHVGRLDALEDEYEGFTDSGYVGDSSPNRADAAIWGITELFPQLTKRKRKADDVGKFRRLKEALAEEGGTELDHDGTVELAGPGACYGPSFGYPRVGKIRAE